MLVNAGGGQQAEGCFGELWTKQGQGGLISQDPCWKGQACNHSLSPFFCQRCSLMPVATSVMRLCIAMQIFPSLKSHMKHMHEAHNRLSTMALVYSQCQCSVCLHSLHLTLQAQRICEASAVHPPCIIHRLLRWCVCTINPTVNAWHPEMKRHLLSRSSWALGGV